jgi:hypothetical protein
MPGGVGHYAAYADREAVLAAMGAVVVPDTAYFRDQALLLDNRARPGIVSREIAPRPADAGGAERSTGPAPPSTCQT